MNWFGTSKSPHHDVRQRRDDRQGQVERRKRRGRASFRSVILWSILTLTGLVSATVLLTSYRFGKSTMQSMSERAASNTTSLLQERLGHYFRDGIQALETYDMRLRDGGTGVLESDRTATTFLNGLQHYRSVRYLSYGDMNGNFVGATRDPNGRHLYLIKDSSTQGALLSFAGVPNGERDDVVRIRQGYDPRDRPWFKLALDTMVTSWTDIYASTTVPGAVLMTAVKPVITETGKIVGVVGADVSLRGADTILRQSVDGVLGTAFIIDSDGLLVASSTGNRAVRVDTQGRLIRIEAAGSGDPAVRDAALALVDRYGGFDAITTPRRFRIESEGAPYLIDVAPFESSRGLEWATVAVVDQAVLEREFVDNTRRALILSILILLIGVVLAYAVSRRIARPILQLAQTALRIRSGDLNVSFQHEFTDEIGQLTSAMREMVRGLKDRDTIRDALGRYVNPELADRFIADPDSLALGGQSVEATLLMSDLRGYTVLSETLSAEEMVTLLNGYLGAMTEVIAEYNGTIIEFIGDAIFVVFGAPFQSEDDPERAVRCAIAMQQALERFNEESAQTGWPVLQMGIGLNTGEVVAGNIGSNLAAKYGVIGEAVNLTARVESLTTSCQIFITAGTKDKVGDELDCVGPRPVRLKGLSAPVEIFEVVGIAGVEPMYVPKLLNRRMKEATLQVDVHLIHGVEIDPRPIVGQTLSMGLNGVLAEFDEALPLLQKVMIRLTLRDGITEDIYATIGQMTAPMEAGERWLGEFTFTTIGKKDEARLEMELERLAQP